jgi:transcriptional regulator with XRE-family HTH domain
MSKILLRIHQFAESQGLSIRELERSSGITQGLIAKAIKNGSEIGSDKLENITQTYGMLSAEWLLRGEGEMLKQNLAPQNGSTAQLIGTIVQLSAEIERLKALLDSSPADTI